MPGEPSVRRPDIRRRSRPPPSAHTINIYKGDVSFRQELVPPTTTDVTALWKQPLKRFQWALSMLLTSLSHAPTPFSAESRGDPLTRARERAWRAARSPAELLELSRAALRPCGRPSGSRTPLPRARAAAREGSRGRLPISQGHAARRGLQNARRAAEAAGSPPTAAVTAAALAIVHDP